MANIYDLDTLRNDLDREFRPLEITVAGQNLVLQNLMRINKTDREHVLAALKEIDRLQGDDETSQDPQNLTQLAEHVTTVLRTVVTNGQGQQLVDALGDDLMLTMRVMELWTEATQPGEAPNSPA